MNLIIILGLLVGGYLVLTLGGSATGSKWLDVGLRGRISLALVFAFTGLGHFVKTGAMVEMLPDWVPARVATVYGTGVVEWLAVAGLLVPRTSRITGMLLIAYLVLVFPANVYAALKGGEMGGGDIGPAYLLLRAPLQLLLIGWTYWFAVRSAPRPKN